MMRNVDRRKFMKLGAAFAALSAGGESLLGKELLEGDVVLKEGGVDFSPITHKRRRAIPSACWQCVTRDPIIGFVEDGRLVKIEGNPELHSSNGKLCAKGLSGINQVYNPDRLLYPLKRVGKRGEGKWKRISWDEALDLVVNGGDIAGRTVKGIKTLRDAGTPEKFMFHYGRVVGTDWLILMGYFLRAYGTATIGDHNSICINAGSIAHQLTGGGAGSWDFETSKIVLNFGSNLLEAHINHLPMAKRCAHALANGLKMYTFDVRLSNTAAKSTEWVPIRPATDLAVILAMCNVLIQNDLYDEEVINNLTNVSVDELKRHLIDYTPEWAENISGVPSQKIRSIAVQYGTTKPGRCISLRGAFMHHNGVQTERAIIMLEAIAGNVDRSGPPRGVSPRWRYPLPFPQAGTKSLNILRGEEGNYAFPDYGVSHQILTRIDKGPERPEIYMLYCHNPVYSNGNCEENARVFKDEEKVPFLIAIDIVLSESSELADLVLPDATYLERWTCESKTSPDLHPEYYIRQPMHPPLGEARNFCDVACELAERLGLSLGFDSAEEFVRRTCETTPGIREAGGFDYMKEHGFWIDKEAKPVYVDRNKLQVKSEELARHGFSAIPDWTGVPEHEEMADDELILTTFKSNVQTHSRTQNCKWLTEIYHDNSAWINSKTAAERGIKNGDTIRIESHVGKIVTKAFVTEGVHPKAIAVSHHGGHWAHGVYASSRKSYVHVSEADCELKWWEENGEHINWVIPNRGDPISGSLCWNDTVVKVTKA